MTGTFSRPIGDTNSGTNDWSDVAGEDKVIIDGLNGLLNSSNKVTDAALASPNNSVYKALTSVGAYYFGATVTGTYYFGSSGGPLTSGVATSSATSGVSGLIYFDDADYTVGSLTQKLRIRQQVIVGSTSPSTVTLNCGLYPVTISAGNWTLGSVVASSATSTAGLATNTISSFTSASGDFTIPSDGAYCLGVVVGSITVPAGINVSAQLQTRNV